MKNTFRWLLKRKIRFFSARFRKQEPVIVNPIKVRRVAYYIAGGIGDAVMAFPALKFIQKKLPDAELTVFVPRGKYFLVSALFENIRVRQFQLSPAFLILYGIPARRFDLVFTNTVGVFKLAVEIAAFCTGRIRCGFRYPEEGRYDRLYTISQVFSDKVHASEQNVRLVAETVNMSFNENDSRLPVYVRDKDTNDKEVVIHPGSEIEYKNKRWPMKRFSALITRLLDNGFDVTVLLGPEESDLEEHFKKHGKVQVLVDPSPGVLIETLKNAGFFIGNDSGPAHIAAFYSVPEIVLFGPVQPERSAPQSSNCIAIYNAVDCSPCHFSAKDCVDNMCMNSITVEQVWREVSTQWIH